MDATSNDDILDDNANLESKVIKALNRLQKRPTNSAKLRKKAGVSVKQVSKYLKVRFRDLDGDVESQVMTAMLQCVRNGLVCALTNGRYFLLGPRTKTMITTCYSRSVHGTDCTCTKKVSTPCCTLSINVEKLNFTKRQKIGKKTENPENGKEKCPHDILCYNCFELHPPTDPSAKTKCMALPVQKSFKAPLNVFSPRDEKGPKKTSSGVKKQK